MPRCRITSSEPGSLPKLVEPLTHHKPTPPKGSRLSDHHSTDDRDRRDRAYPERRLSNGLTTRTQARLMKFTRCPLECPVLIFKSTIWPANARRDLGRECRSTEQRKPGIVATEFGYISALVRLPKWCSIAQDGPDRITRGDIHNPALVHNGPDCYEDSVRIAGRTYCELDAFETARVVTVQLRITKVWFGVAIGASGCCGVMGILRLASLELPIAVVARRFMTGDTAPGRPPRPVTVWSPFASAGRRQRSSLAVGGYGWTPVGAVNVGPRAGRGGDTSDGPTGGDSSRRREDYGDWPSWGCSGSS